MARPASPEPPAPLRVRPRLVGVQRNSRPERGQSAASDSASPRAPPARLLLLLGSAEPNPAALLGPPVPHGWGQSAAGTELEGLEPPGMAWHGMVWYGMAWTLGWHGMAWPTRTLAWHGMAWAQAWTLAWHGLCMGIA